MNAEPLAEFRIGDVVVLNSGGPEMTVVNPAGETVWCRWMTADGLSQSHEFPAVAITLSRRP
jgi:uncharacterized protein YodC (DUF2158 family)